VKAFYNSHALEAIKRGDCWYILIDGEESAVEPAKYKRVAINRAVKALQEQERGQAIQELKELGL
jgi:hypothetical protein